MKIVHVGQFDPAGVAWNLSMAVNANTLEESSSIVVETTLAAPTANALWTDGECAAKDILRAADVQIVHCGIRDFSGRAHASEEVWLETDAHEAGSPFHPFLDREKVIIWLDGSTAIRSHVERYRKRYEGYRKIATNADIAALYGAFWLPPCISADYPDRTTPLTTDEWTLAHPYSDKQLKGADAVAMAVSASPGWRLEQVSGVHHDDAMRVMGSAHAIADHFQGYFGVVALEATAMGKPLILRLSKETREAMLEIGWAVPGNWLTVESEAAIGPTLRGLRRESADLRYYAAVAAEWWRTFGLGQHRAARFLEWLCHN